VTIGFRDWVAIDLFVITGLLLCSGSLKDGLHTEYLHHRHHKSPRLGTDVHFEDSALNVACILKFAEVQMIISVPSAPARVRSEQD
jgi:hypothetical protein